MSKLDKLLILGIRSFDNEHQSVIKFPTPVTLIAGPNGTGKTTIIECLKYATTGILPPNCKTGGAFIHDPDLCGKKTVEAQVKLQYRSNKEVPMVVVRNLQLQVKAKSRQQSTLEGLLFLERHGERHSISKKASALDRDVPESLGVSTAVLDNVIFCHQDESLWPLSEPANLKRKFDEIFEAQKYIKAIENLNQLRKKHAADLVKLRIEETHAREDKDKAAKAQKRALQLEAKSEQLRKEAKVLEIKKNQAQEAADESWKQAEEYSEVLGTLKGKQYEAQSKENIIRGLKAHLEEVTETDEWLESTLAQFEARLQEYRDRSKSKEQMYNDTKAEVESCRSGLVQKYKERGEYEHARAENTRHKDMRKSSIQNIASKHSIRGYDDPSTDSMVTEFMFKIRKLSKDKQSTLQRVRNDANTEKRSAQSSVDRLIEKRTRLQDGKVAAKNQIETNKQHMKEYQTRVDRIDVDEGTKAGLESRLEDLSTKLQSLHEQEVKSNWAQAIRDGDVQLRAFDEESALLNQELVEGTRKAGEMARVAHLKRELRDQQRSLKTLLGTHSEHINKLIGEYWNPANCENVYEQASNAANDGVAGAERERDSVGRDLEQVTFKLQTSRNKLKQQRSDLKSYESRIRQTLDAHPSEYQTILSQATSNLDVMKSNASNTLGLVPYFESILETSRNDKPACRICERPFHGEQDPSLVKLRNRFSSLITKLKNKVDEEMIKHSEDELRELNEVAGPMELYNQLREKEIPALEAEENDSSQKREALIVKLEEHDKVVSSKQFVQTELEQIKRPITSIGRCHSEGASLDRQIQESTNKSAENTASRTLEDIQQDIASLNEKTRALKQNVAKLSNEQEQCRSNRSELERQTNEVKLQVAFTTSELEKRAGLIARVDEYKAMIQQQRNVIETADGDVERLVPEIDTAQAKYDNVVQRTEAQEQDMIRQCSELSEELNALELINNQLQSFIDRDIPAKAASTDQDIKRVEQQVSTLEGHLGKITREINELTELLRNSQATQRQYDDNLSYRRESRLLAKLKSEIESLAARNAEADRDRFQETSRVHSNAYQKYNGEQSAMIGEVKSIDNQLREMGHDFETDWKGAGKRYREAHIKVETTKAAVEDLQRYASALDKAVIKYHSLKMEEVNRIIDDLWKQTYQGSDIDTIMIKTETEKATATRSHSYRAVMVKQDAEMDMRGRCSAGQKVLASIIIRLALAECFGINCGLIALDEPTTNLDKDNIAALAQALHDIINSRRQQKNFQLIIITHDDEFLRMMRPGDFVDHYYRISRNQQCNSIIQKQHIKECM